MLIFKQNRWVALLLGVILVCFSAIYLLLPTPGAKIGLDGKRIAALLNPIVMYEAPDEPLRGAGRISTTAVNRMKPASGEAGRILTGLYAEAFRDVPDWNPKQQPLWINASLLTAAEGGTETMPAAAKIVSANDSAAPQNGTEALLKEQADIRSNAAGQGSQAGAEQADSLTTPPPLTLFFTRTELLSQDQQSKATWTYAISDEELLLLQKIVMAEAEGEPYEGKVAVANVVLNRLRSANFPDTIKDVIYQKRQFSPVANGRLARVTANEESVNAVNAALSGVKKVSDDTYFFLSLTLAQDLSVHHTREYAKTIGNHTFYK